MSFSRTTFACAKLIGKGLLLSSSSLNSAVNRLGRPDTVSCHALCWGGISDVEIMRVLGSTRKSAAMVRLPGLVASLRVNGYTHGCMWFLSRTNCDSGQYSGKNLGGDETPGPLNVIHGNSEVLAFESARYACKHVRLRRKRAEGWICTVRRAM